VPTQDRRDARLRHRDTEFLEFADDPEVAPPGVLPRQAADQLHGLFGKGWTTWSAVREGPAPADQRAVPSEDCLRRDEERSPELLGYESGQEGDEGTVGPGEAGTGDLAAEHSQLVAPNKDLCILGRSIRPVDANDLEHASEQTVEEGQGRDGSLTEGALAGQTRSEGFWTLQGIPTVPLAPVSLAAPSSAPSQAGGCWRRAGTTALSMSEAGPN